ncbi:MAG: HD domain-containing protein [Thermoplasmata archaeon]
MTIGEDKLEVIMDYAICMDWVVAFDGKSKGNQHLHRVNKIVEYLADVECARHDICVAGGWFHDLGLINGNKGHCFAGVKSAKEYLTEIGVDPEDIEMVTHCIEAHDGEVEAETPEAKVVHDADTIDKMGPLGFVRHVWKISLVEDFEAEELVHVVSEHLANRYSKLYFSSSADLIKDFVQVLASLLENKESARRVVETVSRGAGDGVPSEKVAEDLFRDPTLDENFCESIRKQMSVDYLP